MEAAHLLRTPLWEQMISLAVPFESSWMSLDGHRCFGAKIAKGFGASTLGLVLGSRAVF